MPTRSYAEGRDMTNFRTDSMTAEEVVTHADMRLRAYSYASPALIRRQRRSRISSSHDADSDDPPQPLPWAPGEKEPEQFADYLAKVQALPPGETAANKLVTHFPLKAHMRAESKEHVLYYDNKQEQWTEDKADVVEQPLTTSTRLRRCWDEEEPAPRDASAPTITNPPPKSVNIFSAFSLVHYARTWRKKAKRRFMIARGMYSKAGEDVVIPTISKTPEVKAMLWKAIQANEMLHSMDETTVMRMLMAMTHETHAAQEVVTYQGDPPKLFVVESGRVQGSYHKLGSKVDHPLAWFGEGQVMGEVTMIGGGLKASMTLKADVDCSLYVLDRAIFVAIMKHETMMKNRLAFMRSVCLDGTAVFKAFTDSDMMRWALQFVEFTADPGYHFTEQGKTGTDWYLVMAGEVDVVVNDMCVRTLGKYSWFGEGAVLSGNNLRNASCVAATKTTVLKLDGTLCEKLFPWLPFTKVYQHRCITNVLKELPIPLMKNMHESDAASIEGLFRASSFRQGATVVTQGTPVTHFFIMTKGEAAVLRHPDPPPSGLLPSSGSQGSLNGGMNGMGGAGMSGGMSAFSTPFATNTSSIPDMSGGMRMPDNNASPSLLPMPLGAMIGGGVGQSPGGSQETLQPQEVATLQCGPQGHFGFKGMVTGGVYGGSVVVKSAQMDCVVLHVSQWQQLLSIVHRRHWVDQIATWPLFATLNAIQRRSLNDNLHYVQFPAGQVVVRAGSVDTRLYLVVQGEAVGVDPLTMRARGSVMRMGQFFGEESVLSGAPYEHSIMAASALGCFYLDKQYIETHMGQLEALLWEYVAWKKLNNCNVDNPIVNRLKDRTLVLSSLNVHRVLGKGQFGKVILVSSKQTGIKYALKVLNKADIVDQGQVEHVRDEKDVLESLDHPFCNQLVTTFHDKANLYMLISLCQGGDLLAAQESWKNARMDESCVQFYLGCIVLALEYMHSLNIAYRDMKQENMMIDAQGYLKMVDYGLSKVVSDGIKAFTVCGTAQFIAPEVITCKGHGKEVDMWSLGVLAFELLVGESPFVDDSDMEPEEIFKSIVRGRYKIPSFVSANAADLIMNLLRREPNARLGCGVDGFKRLKAHAFFRTMDWRKLLRRQITPPFVPEVKDETNQLTTLEDLLDRDEDENTPLDPQVEALLDQHF